MTDAPLQFTNAQIIEAVQVAPAEVQQVLMMLCMDAELRQRRAEDEEDTTENE